MICSNIKHPISDVTTIKINNLGHVITFDMSHRQDRHKFNLDIYDAICNLTYHLPSLLDRIVVENIRFIT